MKARVKYNNEIIDVVQVGTKTHLFDLNNVEFLDNPQDYWTRLEHQYAGMAMQGILGNQTYTKHLLDTTTSAKDARDIIVDASWYLAHTLVEKMKEKK